MSWSPSTAAAGCLGGQTRQARAIAILESGKRRFIQGQPFPISDVYDIFNAKPLSIGAHKVVVYTTPTYPIVFKLFAIHAVLNVVVDRAQL